LTYENTKRFDNGPGSVSAFVDLSGVNPNPLNTPVDGLIDVEALSGSAGNDQFTSGLSTDVTIPTGVISGTAGTTVLTITGTELRIADGSLVSGVGIPAGALVFGPPAVSVVNGVTTTKVDLTVELNANVTGPVNFSNSAASVWSISKFNRNFWLATSGKWRSCN
jgi:hypothetical protein